MLSDRRAWGWFKGRRSGGRRVSLYSDRFRFAYDRSGFIGYVRTGWGGAK